MTDLEPRRARDMAVLEKKGIVFQEGTTVKEWLEIGNDLVFIEHAKNWWIGDWILYGEHRYGETYAQALDEANMVYGSLANVVSVARNVPYDVRRDDLYWNHHAVVAKIEDHEEQKYWLARAADEKLSVRELRRLIKSTEGPVFVRNNIIKDDCMLADLPLLLERALANLPSDTTLHISLDIVEMFDDDE